MEIVKYLQKCYSLVYFSGLRKPQRAGNPGSKPALVRGCQPCFQMWRLTLKKKKRLQNLSKFMNLLNFSYHSFIVRFFFWLLALLWFFFFWLIQSAERVRCCVCLQLLTHHVTATPMSKLSYGKRLQCINSKQIQNLNLPWRSFIIS